MLGHSQTKERATGNPNLGLNHRATSRLYHGVALWAVHHLAVLLIPPRRAAVAIGVGLVAAATAVSGATFWAEIGSTMADSTLTIPILLALWALLGTVAPSGQPPSASALRLAGVLTGAATGAKLTLGPLAIGMLAMVAAMPGSARERAGRVLRVSAFAALGLLLSGGYWMWLMARHYDSPLFPFYNAVFKSPWAPTVNWIDDRWGPRSTLQAVFYPFFLLRTYNLACEVFLRDGRIAAAWVAVLAVVASTLFTRLAGVGEDARVATTRLRLLSVFWGVSYVVWLEMFAYYRYAVTLEVLGGVLVIGVAACVLPRWTGRLALGVAVCLALILGTVPPDLGRRPWSDSYFGVDSTVLSDYAAATVLMWDFPQGYVVPHFPSSSRFVRLRSNLGSNWDIKPGTRGWSRTVDLVRAAPDGRLFLLDAPDGLGHEDQGPVLATLGLALSAESCRSFASYAGGFRVCGVRRQAPGPAAAGR